MDSNFSRALDFAQIQLDNSWSLVFSINVWTLVLLDFILSPTENQNNQKEQHRYNFNYLIKLSYIRPFGIYNNLMSYSSHLDYTRHRLHTHLAVIDGNEIVENNTAIIQCKVECIPLSKVEWSFKNDTVIELMSILVLTFNWKLNNFFVAVTFHVYNVCCSTHIKASIYTFSPLNRIITLNDITIAFIYRVVFKRPFHLW
jgi:hypothetical protein